MALLTGDFSGHTVLIYDLDGNHLTSTVIREYDRGDRQIRVNLMPDSLKVNDNCKLLILSSPTPCEFQGKVKRIGGNFYIAMFQGQEKESRGAARYQVNTPALIENLIVEKKAHPLLTPVTVVLLNISTSGVRFRAPFYSLEDGDIFQMNLEISNSKKNITAQVINHNDIDNKHSDYGCKFTEIK